MMGSLSLPALLGPLALLVPACERDPHPFPPTVRLRSAAPGEVEFGRVFEGSVLAHEWELEAVLPVAVGAVKTDCGCTLARLERATSVGRTPYELGTPLAAGERLHVGARYDTRGRRGPARRAVTLTTDAGAPLALALSADVQPWLQAEPGELEPLRVLEGRTDERTLRVRAVSGEPFGLRFTGRGVPPAVRVELRPEDPDDSARAVLWTVRIRLGADAPRGTHSYPIELESDVEIPGSPGAPGPGEPRRFSIAPAWTVQVLGPVALSTPSLEFGLVRAEETVARSVRLESFDPAFVLPAPVTRLEPLRPGEPFPLGSTASLRTRAVDGERAFDVELTLAGLAPEVSGTFLARLVVETGHPELPSLEALVRGVRAPAGTFPR